MASITLTGQPKYQKGFSPLPPDFDYIETNNIKELENAINENTAALFVEAIQGEGGIRPLSAEFLKKARELTKKHNALLIFDEVQTGAGRTGKPFAYQHFDIEPDAITLAKGLGNGIPIGALHVRDQYTLLEPGEHASTFGGNFLATSVAVEVLKILQKKTFFEKSRRKAKINCSKLFPDSGSAWTGLHVGNCNPESGRSIQKPFSEKNPDHKY
jgi:acetylornithine/succinyldiaminopimelate/putrescine aminotransferase